MEFSDVIFGDYLNTGLFPEQALMMVHYNDQYLEIKCADNHYYLPLIDIDKAQYFFSEFRHNMQHNIFYIGDFCKFFFDNVFNFDANSEGYPFTFKCWRFPLDDRILMIDIKINVKVALKERNNQLFQFNQYTQLNADDILYQCACKYYWNLNP